MLRIDQFQREVCWIGAVRSQHKGFACGILKANHLICRPEDVNKILSMYLFGCNSEKLGRVRVLLTKQEYNMTFGYTFPKAENWPYKNKHSKDLSIV